MTDRRKEGRTDGGRRGITLGADLLHRRAKEGRGRGGKRGGSVDGVDAEKVMNTMSRGISCKNSSVKL